MTTGTRSVRNLAELTWLGWGRALRQYHRFEVDGLEHLDGKPKLLVAYHGRAMALDTIVLSGLAWERGLAFPMAVFHRAALANPVMAWLVDGVGFSTGRAPGQRARDPKWSAPDDLRAAAASGRHIFVTPGGAREAFRGFWRNGEVDWGDHLGFVRLAVDLGLPIVPIACAGVDRSYVGVTGAVSLGRLQRFSKMPGWLGLGPMGPFPFSPGFPSKFYQVVGSPIEVAPRNLALEDHAGLTVLAREVRDRVQLLLHEANRRARARPE